MFRYLVFCTVVLAAVVPAAAARAACAGALPAGDGPHAPSPPGSAMPGPSTTATWLRVFVPRVSGVFTAFDLGHSRLGVELPLGAPAGAGPADHNRHLRTGAWFVFLSWDLATDPGAEPAAAAWAARVQTGVELHVALHGLCRRLDTLGAPDVEPDAEGALEVRVARTLERERLASLVVWYARWTGGGAAEGARLAEAS